GQGPVGDHGHSAQGGLGGRVPGLGPAAAGGQALRLRLGRRRVPQRPPGGRPPVHPGADGGHRRRPEGAERPGRRLPGVRGVVEGPAPGLQGPGTGDGSPAGDGGRGPGLLEGPAEVLPGDEGTAALGAQDGQRAGQAAQGAAAQGQGHAARRLAGGDQSGGRGGVRPARGDLPGEVRQGDGVPGQGPGGVAGLLRLPGGALGAPADDQPDRIDVRHGAAADDQDEGEREPVGLPGDGVQADGVGREELAVAERGKAAGQGHRRGAGCRWGGANRSRLRQPSSTTFDNCSLADLKKGSHVTLHLKGKRVVSVTADGGTVPGPTRCVSVNEARNTVTVIAGRKDERRVYHLLKETEVMTAGGKAAGLKDLKEGMLLLLTRSVEDANTVLRIEILSPEKGKEG